MSAGASTLSAAQAQQSMVRINAQNRQAILSSAIDRIQPIATQTIYPANNPVQTFQPRPVGLVKRFIVEVSGVINNSGSTTVTLTDIGLANIISNVLYTDPSNIQRHNTTGFHLTALANAKRRRPYGGTFQTNSVGATATNLSQMFNVGPAAWGVFSAPQTIATGANANFRAVFEIPLAYSDEDLRGAVYSALVNATQQLQITLTQTPIVATSASDNFNAVYSGAAGSAGSITSATITVYQQYLDQLPLGQGGAPVLPGLDISSIYELKYANFPAITANQMNVVPFANYNSYLSTFCVYNSTGASGGRTFGTDTTYWQLTTANASNIWQYDPLLAAQLSREHILTDLPAGCYYFPSRKHPIYINTFGNISLNLTPSTASAGATIVAFWEYMQQQNTVTSGSSLQIA
jgi:hypothetical protein